MSITLYMDQHVPRPITIGLRLRGVNVLTAYEDGNSHLEDPDLLDRAGVLGRVLFTRDRDLLAEATKRQNEGVFFSGVIYAHQLQVSIGVCVQNLELLALAGEPNDFINRVQFLPL